MLLTRRFHDLFQERREKKKEAGDLPSSTVFSNSLSFKIFKTPVSYFEVADPEPNHCQIFRTGKKKFQRSLKTRIKIILDIFGSKIRLSTSKNSPPNLSLS